MKKHKCSVDTIKDDSNGRSDKVMDASLPTYRHLSLPTGHKGFLNWQAIPIILSQSGHPLHKQTIVGLMQLIRTNQKLTNVPAMHGFCLFALNKLVFHFLSQ